MRQPEEIFLADTSVAGEQHASSEMWNASMRNISFCWLLDGWRDRKLRSFVRWLHLLETESDLKIQNERPYWWDQLFELGAFSLDPTLPFPLIWKLEMRLFLDWSAHFTHWTYRHPCSDATLPPPGFSLVEMKSLQRDDDDEDVMFAVNLVSLSRFTWNQLWSLTAGLWGTVRRYLLEHAAMLWSPCLFMPGAFQGKREINH